MMADLNEFLYRTGLAARGTAATWTPLPGGVSSDIWRVDLPNRTLCVKRALPSLKVAGDWQAPTSRNAFEWAWLNYAARHCPAAVPTPIAHDSELGMFAVAYLDPIRYPVWKRQLLEGVARRETAALVGRVLARLHGESAHDRELERAFPTLEIFYPIRLEPYLIATGRRHPDLAAPLHALAERTAAARIALVHGDVSPKNILIGPDGPVFLDAECAWYGDPAFDLAFCLNHFLLKCLARPFLIDAYLDCFGAFSAAYLADADWELRAALEARAASLLPALFLARIDGKSPVEYVTEEWAKALVRKTGRALILGAPTRLGDVADCWRRALVSSGAHRRRSGWAAD